MKLGSMTKKQKVFIEEWKNLPWKKFAKTLFHLQHRLYKASKEKDIEGCKKLQSLILGSSCSRYLAVRQVTQLNMSDELKSMESWIQQPFRRVFIRNLEIQTIRDRAMECLIKYALEPYYEAGFRLPHDIFGHKKMILRLEIEKWFHTIDHNKLLSLILLPTSAKEILRSSLKARFLGVISPLLWKIALNRIQDLPKKVGNQRCLRYADAIILFLKSKLDQFLQEQSLKIKKLVGFDFLGWHFKVKLKNHTFVFYPSKKNRFGVIKKIKAKIRDTRLSFKKRLSKVKIIYLNWRNYHKYCDLSKLKLWAISNWVYRFGKKAGIKKQGVVSN